MPYKKTHFVPHVFRNAQYSVYVKIEKKKKMKSEKQVTDMSTEIIPFENGILFS